MYITIGVHDMLCKHTIRRYVRGDDGARSCHSDMNDIVCECDKKDTCTNGCIHHKVYDTRNLSPQYKAAVTTYYGRPKYDYSITCSHIGEQYTIIISYQSGEYSDYNEDNVLLSPAMHPFNKSRPVYFTSRDIRDIRIFKKLVGKHAYLFVDEDEDEYDSDTNSYATIDSLAELEYNATR